ncbi:MAG TPA: hypothetical protein PK156_50070 [Polyangium sp.]|nr:hypothetical protein [Polyangium sp.]
MADNKAEYKIELDPVFQAKLAVLVETQKMKAPHAPSSSSDMINKATALGVNMMLRLLLQNEPGYMMPGMMHGAIPMPAERAGDVMTIVE